MIRLIAALSLVLSLAECGPAMFDAQVTRFNALASLPAAERGKSFTILPDERQKGSLEFQSYAERVQAELERLGYQPVPASGRADYVVLLDYGLSAPTTHTTRHLRPSVHGGYGSYGYGGGVGMGFPLDSGYDYEVYTTQPHFLAVRLVKGENWRRGEVATIFEGRAVADLSRPSLPQAMPYLARALFEGFPGRSGETVRVNLPLSGQ